MKNAGQIYFLTEADQMISLFFFVLYFILNLSAISKLFCDPFYTRRT